MLFFSLFIKLVASLINQVVEIGAIFWGADVVAAKEDQHGVEVNLSDSRTLTCDYLIHTTNGFTKLLPDIKDVVPVRNQVFVTSPIDSLGWQGCFHVDEGYIYFRNIGNRILIGGARNKFMSENSGSFGLTNEIEEHLHNFLYKQLGVSEDVKFDYRWSGILAVGKEKKPIIRQSSERQFVGIRMGGMGVAISSVVGKELAEMIHKQNNT